MRTISLSILSVAVMLGLTACGSDEKPPVTVVTAPAATNAVSPTKGQQLQDLHKAYEDDLITKEQYKEQKARVLSE